MCKTAALAILVVLLACHSARAEIVCPADATSDLVVNIDDLLVVISAWGPCPVGAPCFADNTGDGVVNIDDLLGTLNAWGPCNLVFTLDLPEDALPSVPDRQRREDGHGLPGPGIDSNFWCTYQINWVAPGSNGVAAGQIICIHCPITWMNACPNLANATFNGVPGNMAASSTGVGATSIGNGFCQHCPQVAGAFRYR